MFTQFSIIQLKKIIKNYNLKNNIKCRNRKTNESDDDYKKYLIEIITPFFELINGEMKQKLINNDYGDY